MMLDANVENVKFLMSVNADVAEFVPSPDSKITKKTVRELNLPKGVTIGGLVRNGEACLSLVIHRLKQATLSLLSVIMSI